MRLLSMACRNIGRNWRRSLLAVLSVLIAIMLIVMMHGLMEGFLNSIVKNYTKNDVGHINITTEGYRDRERFSPLDEAMADSAAVAEAARAVLAERGEQAVTATAERVRFGVVLSSETKSKAALGIGADPETERGLLMLDRSVAAGSYIAGPGETIMGEALASDLGLGVGDFLRVVTEKADHGIGFKKFRIVGLVRTGVNALDNSVFMVGLDDARELLGLGSGAQQVLVMLEDYNDAAAAAKALESGLAARGFAGLSVKPWTSMGDFPRFVVMARSMYFWMFIVIAFLGAFIITNVMMMVVLERRREIGVLKSMGMPEREILSLFVIEGTALGAIGSAVGTALGLALNLALAVKGLDFSSAMSSFEWPMDNVIFPTIDPPAALGLFAIGVAVSIVVSIVPARNAARMNAIDAIRSA